MLGQSLLAFQIEVGLIAIKERNEKTASGFSEKAEITSCQLRPCYYSRSAGCCHLGRPAVEPVASGPPARLARSCGARGAVWIGGGTSGDVAAVRHQAPYQSRRPPTR